MKIKSVTFSLRFLYCMLVIIIVNICLAGDAYSQLPQIKVYDPSQSYEKGIQAQRQREEIRRIQLENQRLQQEMREREIQRQNRIFEERRQNRLLEERQQQEREKKSAISADIETKKQTKDIYTELIKLDELKQKGIITEEEFETQKKKILSENSTYAGMEKPNAQTSCKVQCAEMFNNGELKKGMDIEDCIDALCGD